MTPNRRAFAWVTLAVAAFTVYGSLVPLDFRAPPEDPVDTFCKILSEPHIDSRSDTVVNVMLGVPLGFALLGMIVADRRWPAQKQVVLGACLLPLCVVFASAVEFSQLFTPSRNCSAADILAQTLGSAGGMLAWVLWGQSVTDRARAVATRADFNAAGRILIAYIVLLAFIQTLPFDVSASPRNLYHKLKDHDTKEGTCYLVPFGEFDGMADAERWKQVGKLTKLVGLFFPVGLLAALAKGRLERWGVLHIALAALILGAGMETLQLVIQSRVSSVTDAIVDALAVIGGWCAGRVHREGLALPFAVSWGIIWFAGMTPTVFPPPGAVRLESPRPFNWLPGLPLESGAPLDALENILTKLVLFGLLGVLVAAWRLPPRTRRGPAGSLRWAVAIAFVLGLGGSGLFESSQRWYNVNTPDMTDVLIGGFGAALGVLVASRVRNAG